MKGFMYAIINTRPEIDCTVAEKIANTILIEADKKDLDPMLIAGLIKVESNFDPFAKSSKGAIGLMQIRYSVWKETPILVKNGAEKIGGLYWIDINVSSGTDILKKYIDEAKGDVVRGLWRYNSGQTKLPPEKKEYEVDYVNKVLLATYQIRELVESHHEKFDKQYKCKYKKFIR